MRAGHARSGERIRCATEREISADAEAWSRRRLLEMHRVEQRNEWQTGAA